MVYVITGSNSNSGQITRNNRYLDLIGDALLYQSYDYLSLLSRKLIPRLSKYISYTLLL